MEAARRAREEGEEGEENKMVSYNYSSQYIIHESRFF